MADFVYIVPRMSLRFPFGLYLPAALLLAGCLQKEELVARTSGPAAMGPDCASCHAYPLKDTNHVFHLFEGDSSKAINGPITCLDCHSTALAKRSHVFLDTIYRDSIGNDWSSWDFPLTPGETTLADTIRTYPLLKVDTVAQDRPIPAPARPGLQPAWQEYVTGLAHMNGKVDVEFHPRVSNPAKFSGLKAEFLPEKETCSAVACHPNQNPFWRFADPIKGLKQLEGEPGAVP